MQKRDFKDNPLIQHCLHSLLDMLAFAQKSVEQQKFVLANQLLKSGTSIGANVLEAQSAESSDDIYHKLKIADTETCETGYWLFLCEHAADYNFEAPPQKKREEIRAILYTILSHRPSRK